MANSTFWWLAAGVFVAAELVSGTFYLLMIATGLVAAALAAHAGMAQSWQWIVAALVGGGSVLILRSYRKSQPASAPARANRDVNLDIGETVQVSSFHPDGSCSVHYRGARWDASLMPGEVASPGAYLIAEVVGSQLILKKNRNN
jgi:membrane protein implicated in regulation of membrane protease activity